MSIQFFFYVNAAYLKTTSFIDCVLAKKLYILYCMTAWFGLVTISLVELDPWLFPERYAFLNS